MESSNSHRFITIGEILLRLTPPNYEKIRTATGFEASYGGSEANIAMALANLGIDSTFFTVVPDNSLGKSAVRMLRSNDVHCAPVILSTPEQTPSHRLGTYYLETGYGIRPSKVIYDRKHSAVTEFDFSTLDFDALLEGYTWLHLSGITPALGPNCAGMLLHCLRIAREKKITVSFDGNFRSTLWSWEEARDFCTKCLPYVDVLFGIEPYHLWKEESDHGKGDWKDEIPFQPDYEQQDRIFRKFAERYPNLKCIARHVRYAHSGSENSLKAYMWLEGHTYESRLFTFNILDRVGGGDAFAGGLIYAIMKEYGPEDRINFAVASSAIKHTIRGDANITDDEETIRNLMNMNYDIKR
ncbi:MAG: sugar kinase [Eubacteriales bacterium]|nr:sugar kinase [Eubacteriales bacterium]